MADSTDGNTARARDSWKEIDRFNARMRHLHVVVASMLEDAAKVFAGIEETCRDPRTPEEIVDGVEAAEVGIPSCGWPEFLEKVSLLGHYLDHSRRLLDEALKGSGDEDQEARR